MYPLAGGGYLIDTPGIKGFGLIDIENDEICRYFPDLFRYAPRCGYYNCTHTHEPRLRGAGRRCAPERSASPVTKATSNCWTMTKNTENNDGLLARKIEYISGFMLPERAEVLRATLARRPAT